MYTIALPKGRIVTMRRPLAAPTLLLLAVIALIAVLAVAAVSLGIGTVIALMPVTGLHNLGAW